MRTLKLLHTSENARVTTADTALKPLVEFLTPDGATFFYQNPLKIIAKLFQASGDEMTPDTMLHIFKSAPGKDFNTPIRKVPYAQYYGMSVVNQRSAEYSQNTYHNVGNEVPGIENPEGHKLVIMYSSSSTVDMTRVGTTFEIEPLVAN
jgi:hypothetical protein